MTKAGMPPIFLECEKELKKREQKNCLRALKPLKGLDFSSNDYLSLSQNLDIKKALLHQLDQPDLPLSASASRLIRGNTVFHEEIEDLFTKWTNRESALFFSSGYMANLGLISSLPLGTALFSDQLNHASLIDGCRLSRLPCYVYPHKDTGYLEKLLKKDNSPHKAIITESIFSMGGDIAPLEDLSWLALKYGACLMIDEAHATGIYGLKGRGLFSLLKEQSHVVTIHPCGKALSAEGAFITSSTRFRQYLINKCRTFIYTTAPSPLKTLHIKAVLQFLQKEPYRRDIVQKKAKAFRELLKKDINIGESQTAIVPVILGSTNKALKWERMLKHKGYDIRAIRYPTVPKGQAQLRICIHYQHTDTHIQQLANFLIRPDKGASQIPPGSREG